MDYARRTFSAAEQALVPLTDADLLAVRPSIQEYRIEGKEIYAAPAKESTHLGVILFHFSHTTRHVGMLEGLRGLFDMNGSISV
jgi:hypothetical protein